MNVREADEKKKEVFDKFIFDYIKNPKLRVNSPVFIIATLICIYCEEEVITPKNFSKKFNLTISDNTVAHYFRWLASDEFNLLIRDGSGEYCFNYDYPKSFSILERLRGSK